MEKNKKPRIVKKNQYIKGISEDIAFTHFKSY